MSYLNSLYLFYSSVIEQAVAGVIAGLSAAFLIKLLNWIFRPRLKMYFKEDDSYTIAPNQNDINCLFTHLVVKNIRKSMALGCKVFILKIEKKNNKKFENIPLKIHFTLKWANENDPKGFEGLEIPGNYRRRIDLASSELNSTSHFSLYVEGGMRGIINAFPNGEYRFTIQATGKNTNTITKRFIFKWSGSFIKDHIIIKEEKILKRIWFRIRNRINL